MKLGSAALTVLAFCGAILLASSFNGSVLAQESKASNRLDQASLYVRAVEAVAEQKKSDEGVPRQAIYVPQSQFAGYAVDLDQPVPLYSGVVAWVNGYHIPEGENAVFSVTGGVARPDVRLARIVVFREGRYFPYVTPVIELSEGIKRFEPVILFDDKLSTSLLGNCSAVVLLMDGDGGILESLRTNFYYGYSVGDETGQRITSANVEIVAGGRYIRIRGERFGERVVVVVHEGPFHVPAVYDVVDGGVFYRHPVYYSGSIVFVQRLNVTIQPENGASVTCRQCLYLKTP